MGLRDSVQITHTTISKPIQPVHDKSFVQIELNTNMVKNLEKNIYVRLIKQLADYLSLLII